MLTSLPTLIGFTGPLHSGKTSCANILKEYYDAAVFSFATPLKLGVAEMFDWCIEQLEEEVFKDTVDPLLGFSPRRALQVIGTNGVRDHLGQDIWLKILSRRIATHLSSNWPAVVDDVRFENEANFIRAHGKLIHVVPAMHASEHIDPQALAHSSEQGIKFKHGDLILNNPKKGKEHLKLALEKTISGNRTF